MSGTCRRIAGPLLNNCIHHFTLMWGNVTDFFMYWDNMNEPDIQQLWNKLWKTDPLFFSKQHLVSLSSVRLGLCNRPRHIQLHNSLLIEAAVDEIQQCSVRFVCHPPNLDRTLWHSAMLGYVRLCQCNTQLCIDFLLQVQLCQMALCCNNLKVCDYGTLVQILCFWTLFIVLSLSIINQTMYLHQDRMTDNVQKHNIWAICWLGLCCVKLFWQITPHIHQFMTLHLIMVKFYWSIPSTFLSRFSNIFELYKKSIHVKLQKF
jgi:hypothetical protein